MGKKIKFNWYLLGGVLSFVAALTVAVMAIFSNLNQLVGDDLLIPAQELPVSCEQRRGVDGLCYEGIEPALFGVMIDNHAVARPAAGLSRASLVYETVVEAPITRFLAIFYRQEALTKIGPVRSARPFYVDWMKEFDVPYLHVGGSNEALELLNNSYGYDLNEFYNGQYFLRDAKRSAPHNVFTSDEKIGQALTDKKWMLKNNFSAWVFKDEAELSVRGLVKRLNFSFGSEMVSWSYDREKNQYSRVLGDKIVTDEEGGEIIAKNLVFMRTNKKVIDDYGRLQVKTLGSGEAIVYLDGLSIPAEWRRSSSGERTRFFEKESGLEIAFNSGTTWIEVSDQRDRLPIEIN